MYRKQAETAVNQLPRFDVVNELKKLVRENKLAPTPDEIKQIADNRYRTAQQVIAHALESTADPMPKEAIQITARFVANQARINAINRMEAYVVEFKRVGAKATGASQDMSATTNRPQYAGILKVDARTRCYLFAVPVKYEKDVSAAIRTLPLGKLPVVPQQPMDVNTAVMKSREYAERRTEEARQHVRQELQQSQTLTEWEKDDLATLIGLTAGRRVLIGSMTVLGSNAIQAD